MSTASELCKLLDRAFFGPSWHGTTLRGALRRLTPAQALWRPTPGRHCVWELILHTAYWKYTVRNRIEGGRRAAFPRRPSNWPRLPATPDAQALAADIALLDAQHALLVACTRKLPLRTLRARSPSGKWTNAEQIAGVAAHDLYHAGQVQLLKRLAR